METVETPAPSTPNSAICCCPKYREHVHVPMWMKEIF